MILDGRVIYATTRMSGASTVGTEAIGQTVISLDNTRDFVMDAGFVFIGTDVVPFTTVDRTANTITLATPIDEALPEGSLILNYPYAVQRWTLVVPASDGMRPVDAVWAAVPHALAGFLAADGQREEDDQERVKFEIQENNQFMVLDIIDRQPYLDPFVIPEGAITETNIQPGSITTPLLATNAVATQNLQAGAVQAINIDVDALNGKTITGALIRSAASGRRVQMSGDGLVQFDGDESLIFMLGEQNKFTGEIDATSIIIRDALQLFGRENLFAVGSRITLKASTSAPTQAPNISWDYESGPDVSNGNLWYCTGVHSNGGVFHSATYIFLQYGLYRKATGEYWQFPNITHPDGSVSSTFKPWSMVRIAKADNDAGRVVMIGEDQTRRVNGLPETWVRIYDDSTMNSSGTVAPVLKAEFKMWDFSWFRSYRLGRVINGGAGIKSEFYLADTTVPLGGGYRTPSVWHFRLNNDDATVTTVGTHNFGAVFEPNEIVTSVCATKKSIAGIEGTSTDGIIIFGTNMRNVIFNWSTMSWETNAQFPIAYNEQDRGWADGDPVAQTFGGLYTCNWGNSDTPINTYKYANNHKNIAIPPTIWAGYIWRGESTKAYRTVLSPLAASSLRKMARLNVTMPALPAPIAGVGQPRDPDADAYGWIYYLGVGSSPPANANMYEQSNQPAMPPGAALTVSTVSLSTYPALSGSNPPLASSFPASAAATIESDNGLLVIDGDGDIQAREVSVDEALVVNGHEQGVRQSYTPTVTGDSGLLGTHSAAGYWSYDGMWVRLDVQVVITSVGTAAGNMYVTLPVTAASLAFATIMHGRENQATGAALQAVVNIGAGAMVVFRYDNATILASGRTYLISGRYPVATL